MSDLRQRQPRVHDEKHLAYIRQQPCCLCGDNTSTEAIHVRAASLPHGKEYTGKGEKPDDQWTLPLCGRHHREQHTKSELVFWSEWGVDPFGLALFYFKRTPVPKPKRDTR